MEYLNKVELRGRVTNIRTERYGDSSMTRMCVATNYVYKDGQGVAVIETQHHNVVAWNIKGVDEIGKGTAVRVEGRLRYQTYTGVDGVERTGVDVYASKVEIINEK